MANSNQLFNNLRKYIYAIISIALVLLIIGFYGIILLFGRQAIDTVKENLEIIVELAPNSTKENHNTLTTYLENQNYTKSNSIQFVSKEEGLKKLEREFGEDLITFDFDNPLYDVITFHVNTQFAQSNELQNIKLELLENTAIQDVHYQDIIIENLESNSKQFGWLILLIGSLFLITAIALINNTVRLALNDNRFIIKNMQYVGATEGFIIRPYLRKAFMNGLVSGILAIAGVFGILIFFNQQVAGLFNNIFSPEVFLLCGTLLLVGIVISMVSTFIAVRRFLRKRTVDLYV
ncbi:MAG: cell division protein FtsX [Saprospiraceae bacterium]